AQNYRQPSESEAYESTACVVGAAGFEPATWSTQNSRATRLRYAPAPTPGLDTRFALGQQALRVPTLVELEDRAQQIAHGRLRRLRRRLVGAGMGIELDAGVLVAEG